MTTALTPAESLLLLKPNRTSGRDTVRVTLLWLLAQGLLRIEEERMRATGRTDPSLPPHAASLMQAVQAAQPDGGTVADVAQQARKFYGPQLADFNRRFICPALHGRGLLEQGRVLLLFRRWNLAGAAEQERIEHDIARARTIPALLKSDPAEAAALALAVGGTLLLVEELRPHYRQLVEAMRAQTVSSAHFDDGGSWPAGDPHWRSDDQHHRETPQPGDNLGGFDLGGFDVEALGALDAAAFDASLDAPAGGDGGSGDGGSGDGGGDGGGGGGDGGGGGGD